MLIKVKEPTPNKPPKGPGGTYLVCPQCNSGYDEQGKAIVKSFPPRESWKGGPKQQDRVCLACGHRWVVVVVPDGWPAPW